MNSIIEKILGCENAAIFCHTNCDGDSVGSAFALKEALKGINKKATVFIDTKIPDRLLFLPEISKETFETVFQDRGFDIYIALDCGSLDRLGAFAEVYAAAPLKISIDHHDTNTFFGDLNLVVSDASSTGEVLFSLFEKLNIKFTAELSTLLYASISSDTGCFKYTNTKEITFISAAKLLSYGADTALVNKLLFDTVTIEDLLISGYAMSNIKFCHNNEIAYLIVNQDTLKKLNCTYESLEMLAGLPRSVKGVEIGIVLKEKNNGEFKASIRTNLFADATEIARPFGGGGHKKASGCTIYGEEKDVCNKILEASIHVLRSSKN